MQGSIFTAFSDMIIDKMGMGQWNELIKQRRPESQGYYTRGEQYADSELINMLLLLSDKTGLSIESLVESFGQYLFTTLYNTSPADVSEITDLREFLLCIDSVIHVEVKRLHPNAYVPKFEYTSGEKGQLIMHYKSKRKLCHLSIGLIKGAADYFHKEIEISHPQSHCVHNGADRCKLVVDIKE